jgi:hypothetical protein
MGLWVAFAADRRSKYFTSMADVQKPYLDLAHKLRPLADPLPPPRPGDWLAEHPEPGQTFGEYPDAQPVRKSGDLHRRELASMSEEYEVDPIKDLRPVCPNCHAILHTSSPALSITQLQKVLSGRKPIRWPATFLTTLPT